MAKRILHCFLFCLKSSKILIIFSLFLSLSTNIIYDMFSMILSWISLSILLIRYFRLQENCLLLRTRIIKFVYRLWSLQFSADCYSRFVVFDYLSTLAIYCKSLREWAIGWVPALQQLLENEMHNYMGSDFMIPTPLFAVIPF